MREILFRGKRVDNGEWVEGLLWKKKYNDGKRIFISCFPDKDDNEEVYVVCPETIGQFTGLTDKNGKKIFEGDIIKDCDYGYIHSVKYFGDEDYPAFDCDPEVQFCECNGLSHLVDVSAAEVIGNIHDDPEWCK